MFKKAAQQVRIITEHFACVGLGTGQVGAVWVVSAGVQMPPALEQNSEEYAGVIPPDAIRFDEAGLKAYIRDNTPRPEPVTEPDWTEEDIKSNFGWTEKQLRAARTSGFPKPTGHRTNFDGDGVPTDRTMTWTAVIARNWFNQVNGLVVTGQ